MESVLEERAVLLGLAEVRAPFKNLSVDERDRIVHICYRKLLDIEFTGESDSLETNLKCIGVVDSFYALQEVIFSIKSGGECFLYRKSEVILKHSLQDVIIAVPAFDCQSRLIIVSRTQNFGRTLLVIQLQSNEVVKTLVSKLIPEKPVNFRRVAIYKSNVAFRRRGQDSFGKAMSKRVNNLLSSLGGDKSEQPSELPVEAPEEEEAPECPLEHDEDDDDDINSDSEQDDVCDGVVVKSVLVNSLYEPRPSFDRNLLSPLEAEIQYLIQSEIGFVDSLMRLQDCKTSLTKTSALVKKQQFDIMFKFVDELFAFHMDLLTSLKSCGTDIKYICNLFNVSSEKFRHHVNYISNISSAEKIYNIYQEGIKQINPDIGEDLRKPRMRMNHYILTLDSLKKSCEEQDVQFLQDIILMFKEYLKEADTRLVTDFVVYCPFNLMDYGYLIINGELSLRKGEGLSKKHYQVLLLEKMLVLTLGSQDSSEYVASFHLKDTILVHDLRGVMIHLKIKTNRQKTILAIFKANSVKLQQKWIEKLKTQINIVKMENQEKQLKEQIYITQSSKTNNSKEKVKNTESFKANEPIMPPITMKMSFKTIYQDLRTKYSIENLLLCMKDIQETEKLLIKNMEHILSLNLSNSLTKLNDVKQAYEFHLRYFYPAVSSDKEKFDIYIVNSIDKHKINFMKISERMLYHAAIIKYDDIECKLAPIFNIFVDNFFRYRIYLCNIPLEFNENFKKSPRDMECIFEDIRKNLALFLKHKYITNIPTPFSENVVMEGLLFVKESLEDVENKSYIIITRLKTYFLSFTKESFNIYAAFNNDQGKFGNPTGMKSFQIKFMDIDRQKRKFNLTTTDVETKTKWTESFRIVLPRETKIRRRARSEQRMPKNKVSSNVSVDNVSLKVKEGKLVQYYTESHL